MRTWLAILALLCVAAAPVEAPRPCYGTYLRAPVRQRGHRLELSEWLVFTPRGWVRSQVIDHATGMHLYNYVFGRSVYVFPRCQQLPDDVAGRL